MGYKEKKSETPPLRGMSIFTLATNHPIPPVPDKQTRRCSAADVPPPMESSRRADPCAGGWKPKPKIKLDDEAALKPTKVKMPETVHFTSEEPRVFSIADALNMSAANFLEPIQDKNAATQGEAPDLPPLTNHNLDQLILWHGEHIGGHSLRFNRAGTVWLKQENQGWVASKRDWDYVANALRTGAAGAETRASSVREYIDLRKPKLTPEYVAELLKWTAEKTGSTYISPKAQLWIKDTAEDGAIKWRLSLHSYPEISHVISKHDKKYKGENPFNAASLPDFKRNLGYPTSRQVAATMGIATTTSPS